MSTTTTTTTTTTTRDRGDRYGPMEWAQKFSQLKKITENLHAHSCIILHSSFRIIGYTHLPQEMSQ